MDNDIIAAKILFALARKRKWGKSYTAYENMLRQFKTASLGKTGMKHAKNLADDLVKQGFILKKPTNYGLHVYLNPKRAQEIKKTIHDKIGFSF